MNILDKKGVNHCMGEADHSLIGISLNCDEAIGALEEMRHYYIDKSDTKLVEEINEYINFFGYIQEEAESSNHSNQVIENFH